MPASTSRAAAVLLASLLAGCGPTELTTDRPIPPAADAKALALVEARWATERGAARDEKAGFKATRAAAEKGLPDAEYEVAMAYQRGSAGVARDPGEARYWFVRAARHGHPDAAEHGRRLLAPTPLERVEDGLTGIGDAFLRWLQGKLWPEAGV